MGKNTKRGLRSRFIKALSIAVVVMTAFSSIIGSPPVPKTASAAASDWKIKSIDTQIISKCWNNVPQDSINKQVQMLKDLGVNYIAIGTPYDRPAEMEKWTTAIHNAGLKVWFRSHWLNWEGDEGQPKNMTAEQYLAKTKQFIIDNPTLFKAGDSFTVNVEAENAGVGADKPFADWAAYRAFLVQEIDLSNQAFSQIGLGGKIATNWLSMNGWIIENALDQTTVSKMGLITPDHYSPQGNGTGEISSTKIASDMSADLDRFYAKWKVPIMIGEWGYNINGDVSDQMQKEVVEKVYQVFAGKSYIYGVSYWDHMGNQTKIINDNSGTPTTYRPAADVIKSYFSGNVSTPTDPATPSDPTTTN
ncbi:MAG TPA: hypothetical protein PK263_02370, partial [bacterium]|nr:hypothetical protein [bacterium]